MRVDYLYCPACAEPLTDKYAFGRQRRACTNCGFVYFEEPKVAVAAVIRDDQNRVLLVKRGVKPGIGLWAVPSGFVDTGEDPRHAAEREVREETGLEIRIERVLDVLPLRSEDTIAGVTIFFHALPTGGTLSPDDDVCDVRWVSPSELDTVEMAFPGMMPLIVPF